MFSLPFPILLPFAFFHPHPLNLFLSLLLSVSRLSSSLTNMAKIALFLYNAHIRRSYCNLVRSRFRVIGEEKYFHGCGAPTRKRWLLSQSLFLSKIFLEAKITRSHKFTVKTESFSLVLVSPLSLSNIYRGGFSGVNEIRRSSAEWNGIDFMKSHISANSVGLADTARRNEFCLSTVRSFVIRVF